jgi:hypothetical protein
MPRRTTKFSGKKLFDYGNRKALFGWVKVPTRFGYQEMTVPFKIRKIGEPSTLKWK